MSRRERGDRFDAPSADARWTSPRGGGAVVLYSVLPLAWVGMLAQDDDIGPFIFGAIFAIIWAVGALLNWINKRQQEERRKRLRTELEGIQRRRAQAQAPGAPPAQTRPQPNRPIPLPPRTARPAPPPPLPPRPTAAPPRPVRRPNVRRPAPKPVPPPAPVEMLVTQLPPPSAPPVARSAARPSAAPGAAAIARWLTPQTLRTQFILTEILQPPVSLREPRDIV